MYKHLLHPQLFLISFFRQCCYCLLFGFCMCAWWEPSQNTKNHGPVKIHTAKMPLNHEQKVKPELHKRWVLNSLQVAKNVSVKWIQLLCKLPAQVLSLTSSLIRSKVLHIDGIICRERLTLMFFKGAMATANNNKVLSAGASITIWRVIL